MKNPSTNRNAAAAVYRDAANRVEKGDTKFSCIAIDSVVNGGDGWDCDYSSQALDFQLLFSPFGFPLTSGDAENGGGRDWRILALCFMAAMVEAGDA